MTDFKSHKGTAFKAVNAYVEPDKENETAYADKVVFESESMGKITHKPRFEQEEEKKVNGVKVKDTVLTKYPIAQLPDEVKEAIQEVNNSDGVTFTATVGEAIQDSGSSSYFISRDNFDTLGKDQETFFDDDEEETAEEFAEKEVNQ